MRFKRKKDSEPLQYDVLDDRNETVGVVYPGPFGWKVVGEDHKTYSTRRQAGEAAMRRAK